MSANVFTFPSRSKGPQPWTNDELAELYRVVDLLGKAGLAVITDMGMSDEGDPWFVFCRADNEEVIAHFARIDGHFVAASIAVDETFRGANFRQIVDRMVSSQPLVVPKPGNGSRLLLHPAVLLTAFVATALAHSEKMLAQDLMRSVEAQWDHSKTVALNELKHIKTGWLDTLHTLWKLPLLDGRLAHDAIKETQALTLASLIAIAMTALQPIAEKISAIAHIIADEFPGHGGNAAQSAAAHAALAAQDAPVADLSGQVGTHGNGHAHSGDDAPQAHKIAAATADGMGDGQKAMVDGAHAVAAATVQKAGGADEAHHAPVHTADTTDANSAFLVMQQQKAVTMVAVAQQQAPEPSGMHLEMGNSFAPPINPQDVTTEAKRYLDIGDHPASTSSEPSLTAAPAPSPQPALTPAPAPAPTDLVSNPAPAVAVVVAPSPVPAVPAVTAVSTAGPQEINTATASGVDVINAISNFVTSGSHVIADTGAMSLSGSLRQELSGYFGSNTTLKIIVFDATAPVADVFSFSPGVVFVADKDFTPSSILYNHGGNLTLDVTGGTVTLVGVASLTIDHSAFA